jgi:hypothetical protein
VVGPAVPPSVRELETELRREDYLVTNWLERFANERLVHVRPARFSRVKNVTPSSCAPRMTLMPSPIAETSRAPVPSCLLHDCTFSAQSGSAGLFTAGG